ASPQHGVDHARRAAERKFLQRRNDHALEHLTVTAVAPPHANACQLVSGVDLARRRAGEGVTDGRLVEGLAGGEPQVRLKAACPALQVRPARVADLLTLGVVVQLAEVLLAAWLPRFQY